MPDPEVAGRHEVALKVYPPESAVTAITMDMAQFIEYMKLKQEADYYLRTHEGAQRVISEILRNDNKVLDSFTIIA